MAWYVWSTDTFQRWTVKCQPWITRSCVHPPVGRRAEFVRTRIEQARSSSSVGLTMVATTPTFQNVVPCIQKDKFPLLVWKDCLEHVQVMSSSHNVWLKRFVALEEHQVETGRTSHSQKSTVVKQHAAVMDSVMAPWAEAGLCEFASEKAVCSFDVIVSGARLRRNHHWILYIIQKTLPHFMVPRSEQYTFKPTLEFGFAFGRNRLQFVHSNGDGQLPNNSKHYFRRAASKVNKYITVARRTNRAKACDCFRWQAAASSDHHQEEPATFVTACDGDQHPSC